MKTKLGKSVKDTLNDNYSLAGSFITPLGDRYCGMVALSVRKTILYSLYDSGIDSVKNVLLRSLKEDND